MTVRPPTGGRHQRPGTTRCHWKGKPVAQGVDGVHWEQAPTGIGLRVCNRLIEEEALRLSEQLLGELEQGLRIVSHL